MQILLVEDNPDHADLLMECIQEAFSRQANIDWHTELGPALTILNNAQENNIDICLCDLALPDSNTQETIFTLNQLKSNIPIIVLTSLQDEEKARSLIKGGIQDYIGKDQLDPVQLYKSCIYAVERQRQRVLLEEKTRDQAAFCYSLSHDFKGPIRRIGNALNFLKDDLSKKIELTNEEKDYFETIEKNVTNVNTLIGDLYQYLSLDSKRDNFTQVDLNLIIQEALQILDVDLESFSINITKLPKVSGNHAQLVVLFKNLIDNSIKYCHIKPVILIRAVDSTSDRHAVISVSDNGPGIDEDAWGKVYTPFVRLNNNPNCPGTGLGLSIVKRIVDNHLGIINIESLPNKGTTFNIQLPFSHTPLI